MADLSKKKKSFSSRITYSVIDVNVYIWFFSNFSTKPHILYEGAIFLRKFNIKN